ncbi:hypothetical protein A7D00_7150 [Trichophyton violaceum]|uniref:Uncharacterized protein n=1 Tax=Trichophyton violaceum TaxID=34388 RepID=A0A178FA94_TRIVO|nr:hypothetical protein A7D00_7150 [Trichophyton violaceum]
MNLRVNEFFHDTMSFLSQIHDNNMLLWYKAAPFPPLSETTLLFLYDNEALGLVHLPGIGPRQPIQPRYHPRHGNYIKRRSSLLQALGVRRTKVQ